MHNFKNLHADWYSFSDSFIQNTFHSFINAKRCRFDSFQSDLLARFCDSTDTATQVWLIEYSNATTTKLRC
jgi:hypothetical protein